MKNLEMKNLNELSTDELKNIDGGDWIYKLMKAFAYGVTTSGDSASTNVGGMKYGGSFMF